MGSLVGYLSVCNSNGVFTRMIQLFVRSNMGFGFHPKCPWVQLLCSADDLTIFGGTQLEPARAIK